MKFLREWWSRTFVSPEHLRLAWERIGALEKQNEAMSKEIADLRRLIVARAEEKKAPAKARSWREVQAFTELGEEANAKR